MNTKSSEDQILNIKNELNSYTNETNIVVEQCDKLKLENNDLSEKIKNINSQFSIDIEYKNNEITE